MNNQESISMIFSQYSDMVLKNFSEKDRSHALSVNQSLLEGLNLSVKPAIHHNFLIAIEVYVRAVVDYRKADEDFIEAEKAVTVEAAELEFYLNGEISRADVLREAEKNRLDEARKHKQRQQQILTDAIAAICAEYAVLPECEQQEVSDEDAIDIPMIAENVICAAFFIGFTLAAIALAPAVVLALPILMYGYGWSVIDGVAEIIGIYNDKERSNTSNKIWDNLKYFSAAQLLVTTGINLLHSLSEFSPHVLNAFSMPIFGHFCAIGFAVDTFISAGQQMHVAYRAWRKFRDPKYFAKERREAITAELALWYRKERSPTMAELVNFNKKIVVLTKQAEALDYYAECKENGDLQLKNKNPEQRQHIYLSELLIAKEKEKMKDHGINGIIWGAATAVMTAAIFGMPLGVVIAGFCVGIIKGGQAIQSMVSADYNKWAVDKAGGNTDRLLEVAIKKTLQQKNETIEGEDIKGEDIKAIKGFLSEKHQRTLINEEAKSQSGYGYTDYFFDKASEARTTVSNKASEVLTKASIAFYSFFHQSSPDRDSLNIQHVEMNSHMGGNNLALI